MILDLISTVADVAYCGLVSTSLFYSRRGAPVHHVYRSLSLVLMAVGAQLVSVAADILDTDEDGWFPVGLSLVTLALAVGITWFTAKRAARLDGAIR